MTQALLLADRQFFVDVPRDHPCAVIAGRVLFGHGHPRDVIDLIHFSARRSQLRRLLIASTPTKRPTPKAIPMAWYGCVRTVLSAVLAAATVFSSRRSQASLAFSMTLSNFARRFVFSLSSVAIAFILICFYFWFLFTFRQSLPVALHVFYRRSRCEGLPIIDVYVIRYMPRPMGRGSHRFPRTCVPDTVLGDSVRFLEPTKTRVGTGGRFRTGKLA